MTWSELEWPEVAWSGLERNLKKPLKKMNLLINLNCRNFANKKINGDLNEWFN